MGSSGSPRLFALTIGINKYRNTDYPTLKGCVADADAVESYLISTLLVPKSQITSLRNEFATRSAIIQAFTKLRGDDRIQRGNPILIYFAGHGGQTDAPVGWPCSSGKVQMIIPYDCGCQLQNREIVHGIPDLTIGWHLQRLAGKKGNNITVIFDNCFSGSGTRSLGRSTELSNGVRAVNYHGRLPQTLDGLDSIHREGQTLPPGNNQRGLRVSSDYIAGSHILLAACKRDEYAREVNKRGLFTKALLEALSGVDITKVTYKELLDRIPHLSSDQNPQCEGYDQGRIIFGAQVFTRPIGIPYEGYKNRTTDILTLNAGAANGLGKGDVLDIWRDMGDYNANRTSPLGTTSISKVTAFSSELTTVTLRAAGTVPEFFITDLHESKRPVLYVYVPHEPRMQVVVDGLEGVMQKPPVHRADIVLSPIETARIAITCDYGGFCFDVNDAEVNQSGLNRLPHTVPHSADKIVFQRILHQFSVYEYYLRQIKGTSNLEGKVSLEFFRLKKPNQAGHEDWDHGEIEPDNLSVPGAGIDLVQDGSYYVVKLTNKTQQPLYPSLFYFDNCDYSINSLYEPPSAGIHKSDPPLKAGESMIIGYGGEGISPFVLDIAIRRPHALEVGYLKLFISTGYADYSHIRQGSPFSFEPEYSNTRAMKPFVMRHGQSEYCGSQIVSLVVRSPYNPSNTRGMDLSRSANGSQFLPATAPATDRTVFNVVPIDRRGPFHLHKFHDMMKKVGQGHHLHFQHHAPLHHQLAKLTLSGGSYLDEAFREVQEMGKLIAELGAAVSNLESEREQSSQELENLATRVNRIEHSPNLTIR